MLSDSEFESLYVHFYELDTDDLLSVAKYDVLNDEERDVLYEVLNDRRDEVDTMLDILNTELRRRKQSLTKFKIPEEILQKIQSNANLTE
jgi:hypothetical protein